MKRAVFALVVWLLFSSSVSAGCAWILWQHKSENQIIGEGQWRTIGEWYVPITSFEKLSECNNRNAKIPNQSDSLGDPLPNGTRLKYEFLCLPDTVDPRKK